MADAQAALEAAGERLKACMPEEPDENGEMGVSMSLLLSGTDVPARWATVAVGAMVEDAGEYVGARDAFQIVLAAFTVGLYVGRAST